MPADSSLVRIAERSNPKRSFLLVSTVLGKHLPVGAARCRLAGLALGLAVAKDPRAADAQSALLDGTDAAVLAMLDAIDTQPPVDGGPFVVIGFAETATALGEQVATALDATWWQTTTRQQSIADAGGLRFDESHSHAPDQWIAKPEGGWPEGTLVLVDDELTTGATACNLIELLHAHSPRERYVVAALLDGRGKGTGKGPDSPIKQTAKKLGVKIDVVALRKRGAEVRTEAGWSGGTLPTPQTGLPRAEEVREVWLGYEGVLQHQGQDAQARLALADAAMDAAAEIGPLPRGALVLGTGEHLAFAQRAAVFVSALTSSTTRSPVLVSELEGYPIRDGLAFANPDGVDIAGFAYNVHAARRPAIVVHFQDAAHRERGQALLDALAHAGAREVTAVTLAP